MGKFTYGIFGYNEEDKAVWTTGTHKGRAIALAKTLKNGSVRRMGYTRDSWDAPTFRVCSDKIWPVEVQ